MNTIGLSLTRSRVVEHDRCL